VSERRQPPPFEVKLSRAAERELRRLRPDDAARLRRPILALAFERRPPGSARIAGTDLWRVRVGDLRIVYLVRERERVVVVLRVARRSESTYRRL
jgi:mRNA interferase RelE/StbE